MKHPLHLTLDAEKLAGDLRARIEGEVRFDNGTKALYATDASNYRQVPIGVVVPRTIEDVIATVEICRRHRAPLLGRGGGTSLAGQCCNVAVIIDYSKYLNLVLEVDAGRKLARVQPGCVLDDLRNAAEAHHLTFGPDPATHERCTLGGMIGNNSCGVHSIMAGRTADNIEALEVLTYDGVRMKVGRTSEEELNAIIREGGRRGEIYTGLKGLRDRYGKLIRKKYPRIPRRVSGFNLDELLPENGFHVARALVGSEGTCVSILEATVNIVHSPAYRRLLVIGYKDVYAAGDAVPEILAYKPVGLEGMDDYLRNFLRAKRGLRPEEIDLLPEGCGWLLVEFGGETPQEAEEKCRKVISDYEGKAEWPTFKLTTAKQEKLVWEVRKSGLGATAFLPNGKNTWPGWEDAAVDPNRLGDYLREFNVLRNKFGYECAMYGHFGDGCVHMRIDFDMRTQEGTNKFLAFLDEGADLVIKYGGSLSGEHGDGQARGPLLYKMYGDDLMQAFREFKSLWDPEWMMNPGKKIDSYGAAENLRVGQDYHPWEPETEFTYPESDYKFSRATLRCVGVGKCRRLEGNTMCPSFMVTREEKHSTRGRARMLQEMLNGEIIKDRWASEEVKESLDLCLACKGCKSDCPVNVDMASYKAEFFSHYYQTHSRPLNAYATGLIYWWAQMASVVPGVANFFGQNTSTASLMKRMAGIAPQRNMPKFAHRTFKRWFNTRDAIAAPEAPAVILWPDTFNNYFTPDSLIAATEVLESLGQRVIIPKMNLCCGRPLYDSGMLGLARKMLRQILHALEPEIRAGIPLVALEPSCAGTFRDELFNFFSTDELANKLSSQTFTLAEFLEKKIPEYKLPQLQRRAVLHGHCHQKAIMGIGNDEVVLKKLGIELEVPDSGCCGMAGSFGFNAKHYEISMAVGERVLLPAVRAAEQETLIITDGFSCREQVEQATERTTLHLAQVLQMALKQPRP